MDALGDAAQKAHRASRTKKKKKAASTGTGGKKAAVAKPGAFARRLRLSADRAEKRAANPTAPVDRTGGDAAPRVVTVVGPKGVGKSTIIRNLVKHYSKRNVPTITGPITIVAGRKKRITFIEVGPDLPSMIDAAKISDLVLLVIDASFGFEMETFEFLNIAAAHGMPKVMGILTHLDKLRDGKQVRRAKKSYKDRIWAELYDGAKVFYLSGITTTGDYLNREVLNLARFISVTKFPNIRWRTDHPYLLADRVEDITPKSLPEYANRSVAAYGYVRGSPLRLAAGEWRVHLAGVGDLVASNVEILPDPCPPPEVAPSLKGSSEKDGQNGATQQKGRKVTERERIVYAPMAPEVDGISYDRDAVYINLAAESVRFSDKSVLLSDAKSSGEPQEADDNSSDGEGEKMVKSLQNTSGEAVDESLKKAGLQLVKGGKRIISEQFPDGRRRRRVEFDCESLEDVEGSDESSGSDEQDDSGVDGRESDASGKGSESEGEDAGESSESQVHSPSSDSSSEESDVDNGENIAISEDEDAVAQIWKNRMLDNAAARLQSTVSASKALSNYIYKRDADGKQDEDQRHEGLSKAQREGDDETFFRPKRGRYQEASDNEGMFSNAILDDITRLLPSATKDWISDSALRAQLKHRRFGTGGKAAESRLRQDDQPDDGDVDGDFEDLETGEVHRAKAPDEDAENESESDLEAIRTRKIQRKAEFNAAWDKTGGLREETEGEADEEDETTTDRQPNIKSRKAAREIAERVPDPRKVERDRLDKIRFEELNGLDEETRMALEGVLPGRYIRLELQDVPMEFVKYFDPNYPTILGGLKPSDDEGKTFVRARVRRHRFKRGVLKSSDPIVLSIGWRRFQSIPVYDTEDQGGRRRFLKYTPEYLHCNATFWAPSVAPGAGVLLCQSLGRERGGFRIAGSGVVTEVDSSFDVVKKLKLIGEPVKIHKNTAFIKGMFNSELEVSKYIGATIRTVSGIRGTIKKAISETSQRNALDRDVAKSPAGTYRAGFEDKILLSDIVFLRAWVPVEAPKFCSIASTLLDKERDGSGIGTWRMRTVREVREAKQLPIPLNKDSLYKPIERGTPLFAPLKISKKLEGALPYASKPKNFIGKKASKPTSARKAALSEERAVVLDRKEKTQQRLLQAVYTIRNERARKRKESNERRLARRKKEIDREEAKHAKTAAERRKRKFALEGANANRESKRSKKAEDD